MNLNNPVFNKILKIKDHLVLGAGAKRKLFERLKRKTLININEPDYSGFKVMLVYANSPMDNLFPVSVSSIAGALKDSGFDLRLFDTTYYPNAVDDAGGGERKDTLQVAEFDYAEVGIEFKLTDMFDDFRSVEKPCRLRVERF